MPSAIREITVQEDLDLGRIKHLAGQFRDAIEACDQARLPSTFQDFPTGACGDATLLLGKYLEQNGFGNFDYVFGAQAGKTHAWLQKADLFVDITADQFADNDHRVIVEYASAWHGLFQEELSYVADFENYGDVMRDGYRATYALIAARL
jgi:hypothetical protein